MEGLGRNEVRLFDFFDFCLIVFQVRTHRASALVTAQIRTIAWREANRERWRLFERP
jgi:hypothetical protein